jgi:two-component system, LytTR family, response regulator
VKYNCIIVDDDEIDRLTTLSFARRYPFLNITGVYASAAAATDRSEEEVAVMLLDIDMPGISGLEFRRRIGNVPACIFITAHTEYAVEGFELEALDFLVKPLDGKRFEMAMKRLEAYLDTRRKAELFEYSLGGDVLYIKDGHEQVKIKLHEVLYLEALKDYTSIVTTVRKYCVLSTIGNLLKEEGFRSFVRVHRSFAVQKHAIGRLTSQEVVVGDVALPVGRSYRDSLEDIIGK